MYLNQLVSQIYPKIIFLQEIWLPYNEESSIRSMLPNYSVQISTPDQFINPEDKMGVQTHNWHGSAILWHESLTQYVEYISNVCDRFTAIRINFGETLVLAISAYMPTSVKDDEFLETLGMLSSFISENVNDNYTILIGTDSNCSTNATN